MHEGFKVLLFGTYPIVSRVGCAMKLQYRNAASACRDVTDDLRIRAGERAIEAQAARAEAAARPCARQQKADAILATPPAVPGDDCQSAQVRVADWLKGRA